MIEWKKADTPKLHVMHCISDAFSAQIDNTTLALGPYQGYLRKEIKKYLSRNVDSQDFEKVRLLQAVTEFLNWKTTVDENLSVLILNTLKTIQD